MELRRIINILIADVYTRCNIKSFPFDCKKVLQIYGFSCKGYSTISDKQKAICLRVSNDACIFDNVIYYNDRKSHHRIVFTLMHELGHILLGHTKRGKKEEDEADLFASMILAPRIVIHNLHFKTADEIHDYFDISISAANRIIIDYKEWFNNICHTTRKPSPEELLIQERFFPTKKKVVKSSVTPSGVRFLFDNDSTDYIINMMEKRRTEYY